MNDVEQRAHKAATVLMGIDRIIEDATASGGDVAFDVALAIQDLVKIAMDSLEPIYDECAGGVQ
jgi:hypothetical protein